MPKGARIAQVTSLDRVRREFRRDEPNQLWMTDVTEHPSRSKLKPFVKFARTIREHREGVIAAVRLGLSSGRLEGLNSKGD